MNYTLRHLRYFAAASDYGSISDAARALNISQPSISTAISHLERQYDVTLFVRRKSQGVSLTPAGTTLLREARMMLDHAADFDAIATSFANEVSGEIRVASFVNIAPVYMAGIIRSFYEKYPQVTVTMLIGNQHEVLESIHDSRSEVGITFDLGLSNEYRIDMVHELPPRLVVGHNHPVATKSSATLNDVISEPFVFLDLPYSREYFFSLFERHNLRPEQTVPVGSYETIKTYVGNGLGYSLLNLVPKNATNYDGTRVKYVALEDEHRPLKLCCVSLRKAVYRRAVQAFIDHVEEYFV